jgi:hypothetical protein
MNWKPTDVSEEHNDFIVSIEDQAKKQTVMKKGRLAACYMLTPYFGLHNSEEGNLPLKRRNS